MRLIVLAGLILLSNQVLGCSSSPLTISQPKSVAVIDYSKTPDSLAPLTDQAGDPIRGRRIVTNRQHGTCLLCHAAQFAEENSPGNLAPSFAGIGTRLSSSQIRLRVVNNRRINPQSIMPVMYRSTAEEQQLAKTHRVANQRQGQSILSAQDVEDVVAFLESQK